MIRFLFTLWILTFSASAQIGAVITSEEITASGRQVSIVVTNQPLTNAVAIGIFTNISQTIITNTGVSTYTVPAGARYIRVEILGGGGGGGAVDGAASASAAGAGGGGGSYCWTNIISPAASYIVTVGTNGPGGATPSESGLVGGQTTFTNLMTAPGGLGGAGQVQSTANKVSLGGLGGALSTGGVLNMGGSSGGNGMCWAGTLALSGLGADSFYGSGGASQTAAVGSAATGYGAGGSGAAVISNTDRAGGNGSQGIIIVTEFYK